MPPGLSGDVDAVLAEVGTALVVAYAGRVIGLVAVRDTVREETAAVVGKLSSLRGMAATVMLSGDSQTAAQAVARQAGISEAQGGLLPQDKMSRIAALRERFGVVAMVGDGINDAPALAQADIGIAMGAAGSDTALEVADVALMSNSLSALPQFFTLARKVLFTIRANVVFSLTFKAAVTVLAIAGIAGMWMAIVADVGVLLVVVLHAMTLLRRKLE
jgi:Cd2+/Zn2+-exporting ATPase